MATRFSPTRDVAARGTCACGAQKPAAGTPAGDSGVSRPSADSGPGRSLNIAIVTHAYYPQFGGVSEHVHHTCLELRKRGHRVTVITCGHRNHNSAAETDVVRIGSNVLVPYNGAFVNLTVGWNVYGKMKRVLSEGRFDVVHVHCPLIPVLPLAATRMSRDAALFGTFHASGRSSAAYSLFRPFLRKYYSRLDGKIAVSRPAQEFVGKYFGGEYRIIPNGVDPDRFSPDRPPAEGLNDGRLNVLFVGRPDPRKGLEHLIRAMGIVRANSRSPVRLVVVGDGPRRRHYEAMVRNLPPGSAVFTGSVSPDVLPGYFSGAHVFCSPATMNESFGIVLLEAMASAVPVVASDIPGYRSVVSHGQDGLLCRPGDAQEMARAILLLLNDGALRREMGARGRDKALRFSWSNIAREIEGCYLEAVKAKSRTRF